MRLVVDDPTFISKFNELRLERNGKEKSKEGRSEKEEGLKEEEIVFFHPPLKPRGGFLLICYNKPMRKEHSRIIRTVRNVMPTVVSIVLTKSINDLKKELPKLKRKGGEKTELVIPQEKIDAHGMVQVGGGSGFIVDPQGIILTNKHVVNEPDVTYMIITSDGKEYPGEILARDPLNDVAILKIKPEVKLPAISLGDSDTLELGQTVLAFGNALGLFKNTVSQGIVSGLSRSVEAKADAQAPTQELRGLIQTDAAINPGNSGGPLVDVFGRAIGINAAVVVGAQNISFAIPVKAAWHDIKDLQEHGRIRKPLFGVRYVILNHDTSEKMKLPVEYGAYVTKEHSFDNAVVPGSPAAQGGICEHDIILSWNGKKIASESTLQDFLEDCEVGEKVTLSVLRKGKSFETKVTLAERK